MSRPLSLAFILPHSPFSNASFAAATALSTSANEAEDTLAIICQKVAMYVLAQTERLLSCVQVFLPKLLDRV